MFKNKLSLKQLALPLASANGSKALINGGFSHISKFKRKKKCG
jgi:hypothetical protein